MSDRRDWSRGSSSKTGLLSARRPRLVSARIEETLGETMKILTTKDLHARLQAGPVALFDVRGDIEFEKGHIPGAGSAPLGSLVFRVARVMNPGSFVAVYSSGGDCTLAAEAVERLENLKLTNVHCYQDGVKGWQEAGHEIVPSVDPKLITRGDVIECRPLTVDVERAYGGAFKHTQTHTDTAGG